MPHSARTASSVEPTEAELSALAVFRDHVATAFDDLMHHYGIEVESTRISTTPEGIHGHQVAGIIGYTGESLSGTIALRATSAVVRACLPAHWTAPADDDVLGDWIAELANQLLGRTKNKLLQYHASFGMTPPSYAVAERLLVLGCDRARASWIAATTSVGPMLLMIELHTPPDFVFERQAELPVAHLEGEMVLF